MRGTKLPKRARADALTRLTAALAVADSVAMVLRLAVEDVRVNPNAHEVENVIRFATTYTVRQSAALHRHASGTP